MLVRSRDLFVGFLLVLTLGACGRAASQSNTQSALTPTVVATATSVPATATATVAVPTSTPPATVESVTVTATAGVSESLPTTPTVAPSTPEPSTTPITATSSSDVTAPNVVTTTSEASTTVVTTAAAESGISDTAEAADPALLAAGLAAYHANYCGVCHTLDKADTHGTFGPIHNGLAAAVAQHFADGSYHGAAKTPAEYVRESIVAPQAYIVPGYATTSHRMPSYAHLDDATLNALVAFLLAP